MRLVTAVSIGVAITALAVSPARSATISLSEASSDTTPAAWLAATLDYSLIDASTLEIRVTNETSAPAAFDILLVFFNTAPNVEYLSLISAVSSLEGPNTDVWHLGHYGYDRVTAKFGEFDYSLRTAAGAPQRDRISPGETQTFTLAASCFGYAGCYDDVLEGWSENGIESARAALRFAYGPNGDAGFGASFRVAVIPEPRTAALLALGLAALSAARARRPDARGRPARRSPPAA